MRISILSINKVMIKILLCALVLFVFLGCSACGKISSTSSKDFINSGTTEDDA